MKVEEAREWFHMRKGELFLPEEIPFERKILVKLINDSVDPVQQVIVDSKRYIGVVDYEEHNGWYEYIRWDGSAGKVKIGVCAQCVQKAGKVAEVTRTVGDTTEEAREKFKEHYSKEHTRKPDEIETGATLLSGTTIAGNEAIHVGMDGSGSGVDTDLVLGSEALETASFYEAVFTGTNVEPQFSSPSFSPEGVGLDSNNSIWHADSSSESIYQLDQSGSVASGFSSPSGTPKGLGVDSTDSIWYAGEEGTGTKSIFEVAPSGGVFGGSSIATQFSSPSISPEGVGLDSNDCIWHADNGTLSIFVLDQSGAFYTAFGGHSGDYTGLGLDDSCVWLADELNSSVYRYSRSGDLIAKFKSPSDSPTGLGLDSNDCIWHADQSSESFYRMKLRDIVEFRQN
jgi:hypothetical protein